MGDTGSTNLSTLTTLTDDNKRWCLYGIALNHVLVPSIRPKLEQEILKEYNNLKLKHSIDVQTSHSFLVPKYPKRNAMKYENINGNDTKSKIHFDYKVTSHVDFAKLFLQNYMAKFNAFNETCDAAAVLILLCRIPVFHPFLRTSANTVRQGKGVWGHCNSIEWNEANFKKRFDEMKQLVTGLGLSSADESKVLADLNDWEHKGVILCMNASIDCELVQVVQYHIRKLSSYVEKMTSESRHIIQQHSQKFEEALSSTETKQEQQLSSISDKLDQLTSALEVLKQNQSCRIVPDVPMVEDSSNFESPNETSSEASTSVPPGIDLISNEKVDPPVTDWNEETVDSVLLTSNEIEFRATYEILLDPTNRFVKNIGPVYFGRVGNIKVALILTEMGAKNKYGSQEMGEKSICYLKPKTIICVGVCFGLQKSKQKLGDLLISKQIQRYSQVRINPDGTTIPRSEGHVVDGILFRLFKDGKNGWISPENSVYQVKVQAGMVLSGPELVDNKKRCEELKNLYQEALGGEMEGEGLINLGVPCIVCKSIVDWADGNKNKEWQPFAAKVAASFVQHVLKSEHFEKAFKESVKKT